MIMVAAPVAGRLTDRIGPRVLIVAGLVLVAASLAWQSRLTLETGYGFLLPAFIAMGLGMGLVMSPMSTAAMNAVAETKAGLASGLLSMSRMIGGTFGVAVLGAIFQARGHASLEDSLAGAGVAPAQIDAIGEQLGSGGLDSVLRSLPPQQALQAADAAREAFISSLATSIGISAAVAAAGAVLALVLLSAKSPDETPVEADLDVQPAAPELAAR